jgi:quercetin dioxygenase-like cupin family protein
MSRRLRVSLVAGLVTIALGAVAAAGYGDPSGLTVTPLANATLAGPVNAQLAGVEIHTRAARDTLFARLDFAEGGSTGWHTHPGPVIVAVASGTLVVHHPLKRGGCGSETFVAGTGFIETGGDVHEATAVGGPAVVYTTFLAQPGTTSYLVPVAAPAGC